jgi:hypothetical protein
MAIIRCVVCKSEHVKPGPWGGVTVGCANCADAYNPITGADADAEPVSETRQVTRLIICAHRLTAGRYLTGPMITPAIRERMRLSRRSFDRGLAGDFRSSRNGGPRRLLPLV